MKRNTKQRGYKLDAMIKSLINDYLSEDYSTKQIASKLNKDGIVTLHHETIY